MKNPTEKTLLDRVADYSSSVAVRDTPWLSLLMNDILVELREIERLRAGQDWQRGEIERLRIRIKELEDPHYLKGREAEIERLRAAVVAADREVKASHADADRLRTLLESNK
jgi:predicted  nucleic acid-binding Zn-ribbon protein